MISILAELTLYHGAEKRQQAISTGYRPLFSFIEESMVSGEITLINIDTLSPGRTAITLIRFINDKYLGSDFKSGRTFSFFESKEPLGEIKILHILE